MVTWEVKITLVNVANKIVSVSATRTDGEDVRTYGSIVGIIETDKQKTAIMDQLHALYKADIAKDAAELSCVGDFGIRAKADLEARKQ